MNWRKFPEEKPPKDLVVVTILYSPDENKCVACPLAYCPCDNCGWHTQDAIFKDAPVVEWLRLENLKKDSFDMFSKTLVNATLVNAALEKDETIEMVKKRAEDIYLVFTTEEAIG